MDKINIKGEYQIKLQYTRMFKQYQYPIIEKNNLITNNGIKFFQERIANLTTDTIYEICLGRLKNEDIKKPQKTNTKLYNETDQVAPAIGIEENKIVLQSTILTDDMEDVCEIGVKTEGNENNYQGILISHDTFEPLENINITANFLLKYTFSLENTDYTINWSITEQNNIYKTPYTDEIRQITNKEYTIYTNSQNLETLEETPYSYYYTNNILYINTPNNPLKEELEIT